MQIQNNMMKNDRYPEGYLPKIAYHIFKGNDEKVNYFIERQEAQYGEMGVEDPDVITKKFTSKSNPDITYTAKKTTLPTGKIQYSCNCPGVWRSKTRECKHIKELKSS